MYLNTIVLWTAISCSIIADVCSERLISPQHLFSDEPNIFEGTFYASQKEDERFARSAGEEDSHSRFRRAIRHVPNKVPAPEISNSTALCGHDRLFIRWTDTSEVFTSGAIIALCREVSSTSTTQNTHSAAIFASYDFGRTWNNLTDEFTNRMLGKKPTIDMYYTIREKPNFVLFADRKNKYISYTNDGGKSINAVKVPFSPDGISINPGNPKMIIAYDSTSRVVAGKTKTRLHISKDGGQTYRILQSFTDVKAFYWGKKADGDKPSDLYIEAKKSGGKLQGYKLDCSKAASSSTCGKNAQTLTDSAPLNGDITDFLVKGPYMFVTQHNKDKTGLNLFVKYLRTGSFKKANIITTSPIKEVFVYDVSGGQVMLVVNHRRNETNLYNSLDITGSNYSLSLPRVLYHNPNTEVSSHWLRNAVKYRFVDIRRVEGLPSVYFATQLTAGPVGGRYLISKMTFDKGGVWQKIKGPDKDKYSRYCRYPRCSLHVNLLYGSIYRYSKTTPLMSRKSAPGLIMATGVLGTNLKITPDTYLSRDGGNTFKQVLRGKRRFGFGDHGGFVLASDFSVSRYIQYSVDFENFYPTRLDRSGSVDIKMILTEPGEEGLIFLVIGTVNKVYHVFQVNATRSLGRPCTKDDFYTVNVTDVGVGGCAVKQIEQRNASTRCKTGKNHTQVISIKYDNCKCRRRHYICDVQFAPDDRGSCIQIPGTTLVPSYCPEGNYFMQSRGYSKIPKYATCQEDNETRSTLSHVRTPCPVEKLQFDKVKTLPKMKNQIVQVALGENLHANIYLRNGYLPHVNFLYTIGDYNVSGSGKDNTTFNRVMNKPGKFVLRVVVSNPKSNSAHDIHVHVLRKLNSSMMTLRHLPLEASIGEKVTVMLDITNHDEVRDYGSLDYKWLVETYYPKQQTILEKETLLPTLDVTFKDSGHKRISLTVSNGVSSVTLNDYVSITKDLQPKNVRLSYQDPRILKVEWDEVKEPGLKRYRVMYKKDTDLYFSEASCRPKPTETKCEIANLAYYTLYFVKLDAVLDNVYGPTSEIKNLTMPSGKPGVPLRVNLANKKTLELEASWQPPKLAYGKLIGYRYKFYKASASAPKHGLPLNDPKQTSKVFDKLEVNEDYLFEIAAVNEMHVGAYSEARSARTGVDILTLPPTSIATTKVTTTTAQLTWTAPKIKKGSKFFFSPKKYNIYMKQKDGSLMIYNSTTENRYTFTRLNPDTKYEIAIAAVADSGEGPNATFSFTTLMGPPLTPVSLTTTEINSRDAKFAWSPAVSDDKILSYQLYQLSPVTHKYPWIFKENEGTVRSLTPYTKYTFAVTAKNKHAESGRSKNYTFTTKEDKPDMPLEVDLSDLWPLSSSLNVSWKPPMYPNGRITKYTVTWFVETDIQRAQVQEVSDKMWLRIDHLRAETTYGLTVQASTKEGIGAPHSELFKTHYYQYGSQPIIIPFEEKKSVVERVTNKTFVMKFIEKVAKIAGITKVRIADVRANKTGNAILFELISKEELHSAPSSVIIEEMNAVKTKLGSSFTVEGCTTKANAISSGKPHPGRPAASGKEQSGGSSSSMALIIGLVCAAVIIALLFVIVLMFVRHRRKSVYNKFDNQFQYNHDDDTVRYEQSPEVEMVPPVQKHRHKDIETVPLADADELT